jgi:uncharacterized protein involved in exopolysaccharide biosynthesis
MIGLDFRIGAIVISKYLLRGIAVLAFFVGLAVAVCLIMKPQYTATASVLVKIGRELVYRPEVGTGELPLQAVDHDDVLASNIEIMSSPQIKQHVIETIGIKRMYPQLFDDESGEDGGQKPSLLGEMIGSAMDAFLGFFGMNQDPQPMSEAIHLFTRKLKIDIVKKTSILTVSFTHRDPEIAARVANLVVEDFQKQTGEIYSDPNLVLKENEVAALRQAASQAEAKLNAYRQQYGVYAFDNQIQLLLAQKSAIDSSIKDVQAHIAELQEGVAAVKAQRAATPASISLSVATQRHTVVDATEAQLLTMRLQEKQLASRYQSSYQPLIDLRDQIRLAENTLSTQRSDHTGPLATNGVNPTWQLLDQQVMTREADLKSSVGRLEALQGQLASVSDAMQTLSSRQHQLVDLEQDVALRNGAVQTSYLKLTEARALSGLNTEQPSSFRLYQAATTPDPALPSRPDPILYVAIAIILGTFAAAATIFFSYSMNDSFLTPEQASLRLGLPTLAVIGYNRRFARIKLTGRSGNMGGMTMPVPSPRGDQAPA